MRVVGATPSSGVPGALVDPPLPPPGAVIPFGSPMIPPSQPSANTSGAASIQTPTCKRAVENTKRLTLQSTRRALPTVHISCAIDDFCRCRRIDAFDKRLSESARMLLLPWNFRRALQPCELSRRADRGFEPGTAD